jgi:hypothetical protein
MRLRPRTNKKCVLLTRILRTTLHKPLYYYVHQSSRGVRTIGWELLPSLTAYAVTRLGQESPFPGVGGWKRLGCWLDAEINTEYSVLITTCVSLVSQYEYYIYYGFLTGRSTEIVTYVYLSTC